MHVVQQFLYICLYLTKQEMHRRKENKMLKIQLDAYIAISRLVCALFAC
jgi:hypothetical protein